MDPSHPLGGQDGLKDLICNKEGKKYIVAVYFPRGKVMDISIFFARYQRFKKKQALSTIFYAFRCVANLDEIYKLT
jgi:hypothetical protein